MQTVLVLPPFRTGQKKLLVEAAPTYQFSFTSEETVTAAEINKAAIIIGNPPIQMLKNAQKLQWLHLRSAGMDTYTESTIIPPHVKISGSSGAYGLSVSEHMVAMLFALCKNLHLYRDQQQQEIWQDLGPVQSISGSTVLIAGLGDLGSQFAKRVKMMGCYTIGIRKNSKANRPDFIDEQYTLPSLPQHLPKADVVALCLPSNNETRNLINQELIAQMKNGAFLLNAGRGDTIDYQALSQALNNGALGGAALDVTVPEPLPSGHPLWQLPRTIITPHVAGGYHIPQTLQAIAEIAAEKLKQYQSSH